VTAFAQRKPNIIYILADDLGYGELSCYGQTKYATPSLDRLAREGMRFTQAYAGVSLCAPSRSSLMTGLHTGHTRIRNNFKADDTRPTLLKEDVTVAEVLKQAGYATGVIGKWGLGETDMAGAPNKKGFDYFFGFLDQNLAHNQYPPQLWRNAEAVTIPENQNQDLRRPRESPIVL
jgi:arylsulfatase A-like enzyme